MRAGSPSLPPQRESLLAGYDRRVDPQTTFTSSPTLATQASEILTPALVTLFLIHSLMCHSFERLRVIREYRSPRTIRSFTKVFIFIMPIVLSPYYVHMGINSGNTWSPYYIAILSTFIFGSLQGVQDILDDPFDGISEDDINLGQVRSYSFQSPLRSLISTLFP